MADTLIADARLLIAAAQDWDAVARSLDAAHHHVNAGRDEAKAFGWLQNAVGIGKRHDAFIAQMDEALADGGRTASGIAQLLLDRARDFGATDDQAAHQHQVIKKEVSS